MGLLFFLPAVTATLLRGQSSDVLNALFATMQRSQPRVSADATQVGYLVPSSSGAMNVAIAPASRPRDRRLVTGYKQHVQSWTFLQDGKHVLCMHDAEGREEFALDAVDLSSHETRRLSDKVEGFWVSTADPHSVLVATPAGGADVWRVDVRDQSKRQRVARNPGNVTGYAVDEATLEVVAAVRVDSARARRVLLRKSGGAWLPVLTADLDDELSLLTAGPTSVVVRTNQGTDIVGLERVDLVSGARTVLARGDADPDAVDVAAGGEVVAVRAGRLRSKVHVLVPRFQAAFDYLQTLDTGTPWVLSRAGDSWVVRFVDSGRPARYALVDVRRQFSEKLFDEIPWSEARMGGGKHGFATAAFEVQSDGFALPSYLTFPVPGTGQAEEWPQGQWPLVLLVHGGPWARDSLEFDPSVHWLATRGYMVLRVNFRGSRGFGKRFLERGDGQWGDGMLQDMLAGVQQVHDAGRVSTGVAVMGESFGGYAALALLTLPGVSSNLRCGVDEFGPADLAGLERSLPAEFAASASWLEDRLGSDLAEASPVRYANQLRAPVLVAQGDNDPRVPKEQADAFVKAAPQGLVQYLHFAHEGHGFLKEDNRLTFYRKVEAFLTKCFTPDDS